MTGLAGRVRIATVKTGPESLNRFASRLRVSDHRIHSGPAPYALDLELFRGGLPDVGDIRGYGTGDDDSVAVMS